MFSIINKLLYNVNNSKHKGGAPYGFNQEKISDVKMRK